MASRAMASSPSALPPRVSFLRRVVAGIHPMQKHPKLSFVSVDLRIGEWIVLNSRLLSENLNSACDEIHSQIQFQLHSRGLQIACMLDCAARAGGRLTRTARVMVVPRPRWVPDAPPPRCHTPQRRRRVAVVIDARSSIFGKLRRRFAGGEMFRQGTTLPWPAR